MWGPIIGALGALGSAWLSKPDEPKEPRREMRPPPQFTPKESKIERRKRKLIDDLLYSLKNPDGAFSDLYESDEDIFQKYYVDPAKSRFENEIAPSIQRKYIAMGQDYGSGLQDSLTRAGVDMDQLLNQEYMKFQQESLNRRQNTINNILGVPPGPTPQNIPQPQQSNVDYSTSGALKQGAAGYLSSDSFRNSIEDMLYSMNKSQRPDQRRGFQS